jgi:glyoxylase I family protein
MEGKRMSGRADPAQLEGFHHAALRARDFDASVTFYREGLGMTPAIAWGQGDSRAVMLDTGNGNHLEVFAGGAAHPTRSPGESEPPLLHIAFRTRSCDASFARARAAGAVVVAEPKTVTIPSDPPTTVRIAFCTGPDGETIEFFQDGA